MVHERSEKRLLDQGMSYDEAHKLATQLEHKAVKAAGVSWAAYCGWMAEEIKLNEHEKLSNLPPDEEDPRQPGKIYER